MTTRVLYFRSVKVIRWMWRHPLASVVLVLFGFLVAVNGSIRVVGGGYPSLVSPRFMGEKLEALGGWMRHAPRHFFASCGEDRDSQVRAAANRHGIPVSLVRSVVRAESGGGAHRISHAGAMGVMQLMPPTARDLGVSDPFDAASNVDGGVRYLAWLWRRYDGEVDRVVAAYNAGPGVVPKSGTMRLPRETRRYLKVVLTPAVRAGCARSM